MARGDSPLATQFARTVVDLAAELFGSRVIYEAQPLEQLVRDLVGVSAHASTWRSRWVDVGRMFLADASGATDATDASAERGGVHQ
jgi:hypothetical protein